MFASFFGRSASSSSSSSGCPFGWRWVVKLRRMLWRLLASLLLFVLFMKVLSLSSSSSFVLLPMRNEDAWYSVRVLSWKLGKENPLPVTVRTTVVHSFICDSPRLQGLHPVLKAVVLDRSV